MAAQVKHIPETVSTFAPLPVTERGFGIHLNGTTKGSPRLVYGNGTNVVVRYIDEPGRADVFNGHKANVNVAKFSPNGEWIASGDATGIVMVWGAKNKIIKNTVRVCMGVLDLDWTGDGKRIMAGGEGGSGYFGKVFNWDSTNAIGEITNNSKKILSVAFRPDRPFKIAAVNEEKNTVFYEGPPFKFSKSDKSHSNYPNCVRYNPDGSLFATCGSDSKIFLYDGKTAEKVQEFQESHTGSIYSLSWSPDGQQILTCAGDKTAKVWNVSDGSVATNFTFGDEIKDMQVSCLWLGDELITVSLSGEINFLDAGNPSQPKAVWSGHKSTIDSIAVSPDGKQVFSGDREGRLARWECKTAEVVTFTGEGHKGDPEGKGNPVSGLAVSADGSKLFSIGFDDKLIVSDIASAKTADGWMETEGQPLGIAAANNEAGLCAVVTSRGVLHVAENGKQKKRIALGFEPTCVAFSNDDSEVAVGAKDKKVYLYSRSGFELTKTAELTSQVQDVITVISYSKDGRFLTIGDKLRHVFVYLRDDLSKPQNASGWTFHQAHITGAQWSNDSQMLLTSSADEMVITWTKAKDLKSGKRIKNDPAHLQGVIDLKILDDEHYVTVGADRYIRVWQIDRNPPRY